MNDMTPEEQARADELIKKAAAHSVEWTDEQFATRVVELLILDRGLLNAYQRTIEFTLKIFREMERLRREKGEGNAQS